MFGKDLILFEVLMQLSRNAIKILNVPLKKVKILTILPI